MTMGDPAPNVVTCPRCGTRYAGLEACPTCAADPERSDSPWVWLLPFVTAAVGIAFTAGHAPGRVKLLGLFPVAVGIALGAVSGWLARLHFRGPGIVLATTFVVAALCFVGSVLESYRVWSSGILEARRTSDAPRFNEPEEVREHTERAVAEATSLRVYLVQRVEQLGPWSPMSAVAFLVIEVLLGATAAALTARQVARFGLERITREH